jgi:hypothetical protein
MSPIRPMGTHVRDVADLHVAEVTPPQDLLGFARG